MTVTGQEAMRTISAAFEEHLRPGDEEHLESWLDGLSTKELEYQCECAASVERGISLYTQLLIMQLKQRLKKEGNDGKDSN